MLTRSHRQEALSRAYVRAVAAQAGLGVTEPESDYGIDMSLRVISLRDNRRRDVGPQIDLQLKRTTRAFVTTTHLSYDLEVVNYDDLREVGELAARLLVVLVQPEDEADWLSQSADELVLRHCAYWLSLRGKPATSSRRTVRVKVPLENIFSVEALRGIIQRLQEGNDP